MVRVEIDETIERPIEEVFDQLVDIARYPEWMPKRGLFISCRQVDEGRVRKGTRYDDETRMGTVRGEVEALERPKAVVFHYVARLFGKTVMEGWPAYTLEPAGENRTRVHHVAEGHLYGAFKLTQPIIQAIAQGERRRTVDALKRSLEPAG